MCPSVGFNEFLDIELLPQIISWQHEKGCYGKMEQVSFKDSKGVDLSPVIETGDYDYADRGQHLGNVGKGINLTEMIGNIGIGSKLRHSGTGRKLHGSDDALWDGTVVKGRKLLVEKSMKGLSHPSCFHSTPGLEVIKLFSCSTQLSTRFQLLIKLKY